MLMRFFGEKSILITELARELQSQLHWLSDDKTRYLVVIEEVCYFFDISII
jgi:hypothetical protein